MDMLLLTGKFFTAEDAKVTPRLAEENPADLGVYFASSAVCFFLKLIDHADDSIAHVNYVEIEQQAESTVAELEIRK
jgi:hypothetical protein